MRMDSWTGSKGAALGCAVLLAVAVVATAADGKGKSKGGAKLTVLSTQQHQILDAGSISVQKKKGPGGRIKVIGTSGGNPVATLGSGKAKGGKRTISVALSDAGRQAVGGCGIDGLSASMAKGSKKGKKSAGGKGSAVTPLDRDLGACSTGSENPTPRQYFGPAIPTDNASRCDFMDPAGCLQPWPNDYFTVADATTDTGRRLNLNAASMPANQNGIHIDPTDANRADGFSPGN